MKTSTKKPRKYSISFEIETKSLSLDALSKRIKIIPSSWSKDKGQNSNAGKLKQISPITYFRLFSPLPQTVNLDRHLDLLIKRITKSSIFKKGVLPKDARLSFSIAEYWYIKGHYAYPYVGIPNKYLKWLGEHKIDVDIVAYPCSN